MRVELRVGGEGTWIATLRAGKTWALELGRREGSAEAAGGGGGVVGEGGRGRSSPGARGWGRKNPGSPLDPK